MAIIKKQSKKEDQVKTDAVIENKGVVKNEAKDVNEVKALLNGLRTSPRKVRLLTRLLTGMKPVDALLQLKFSSKRAAKPLIKLINSALANASHNTTLTVEDLVISKFVVNEGFSFKRHKPAAFGVAHPIKKRSSRVILVLAPRKTK